MKHPLAAMVFIFSLGIVAASLTKVSFEAAYLLSVAFLIFNVLSRRFKTVPAVPSGRMESRRFGWNRFRRFGRNRFRRFGRNRFRRFGRNRSVGIPPRRGKELGSLGFQPEGAPFSRQKFAFIIFLSFAVFFFGVLFLRNSRILPKEHISRYISYRGEHFFVVRGMVDSQPTSINNKTTFTLQAQEIQSGRFKSPCCGKLIVYCKGKTNFAYGDIVILKGDLSRPYSFGNKRYRAYLANQGIFALLRVRCGEEIITVARNKGLAIKRFSLQLKDKIESSIFRHVPFLAASILDAMLLGEKRNIPPLVYRSMMKSGTVHILVVSGFNTGIVAFIVLLVLKLLRLPRKIRFVLAIGGLVIYCFATGASTPVVRATVMTSILLASYLVKQDADIYNSLSIAALSILLANPRQIFDIGFQLSFASVFSIAYLYPKLQRFFQIETLKIKPLKVLLEGGLVSFSAWLGTVGFIAYHFRMFSAVTVLANILIVPLATLITLCGFSLILVSLILPCLTPYFSASSELAVKLLLQVNTFLISLPGAYLYFP